MSCALQTHRISSLPLAFTPFVGTRSPRRQRRRRACRGSDDSIEHRHLAEIVPPIWSPRDHWSAMGMVGTPAFCGLPEYRPLSLAHPVRRTTAYLHTSAMDGMRFTMEVLKGVFAMVICGLRRRHLSMLGASFRSCHEKPEGNASRSYLRCLLLACLYIKQAEYDHGNTRARCSHESASCCA